MRAKIYILVVLIICVGETFGQDPQFSQFYASPMTLNPGFTGNTLVGRFSGNYRHQWPSIPGAFISYSFAYEHNLDKMNSGVGVMVMHDKAGSGGLRFTSVGASYSYLIPISYKHYIRPGIRMSNVWRGIDYSSLVFPDQMISGNGGASSAYGSIPDNRINYLDFATGAVFFHQDYWVGAAVDHINQPNQSLIEGGETRLPMKLHVHGGYNIPLKSNFKNESLSTLTVAANYKAQQKWDQFDLGAYINYNPLVLGVWYRGLPILKAYQQGYQNNDAVVLLVGYERNRIRVGYSYDITISRLALNTGGSHEIAIIFEYPRTGVRKPKKVVIPCAKF